jgi:predicted nuclease of predicted toxin-antitoxin system
VATFFVDRCLGRRVGELLRQAGWTVEYHDDHFAQASPDVDWLPQVAARDWVVRTKDPHISMRSSEVRAVRLASARVFSLTSGNLTSDEMAELFLNNGPTIHRLLNERPAPFIALIDAEGLEVVYPW